MTTWNSIVAALSDIWYGFLGVLPGIIAALVIIIVGYLVGKLLGYIVRWALDKTALDEWLVKKTNLENILGKFKLSQFLGVITKWYVFVWFLPPAAEVLALDSLANFLNILAIWIPNVIAAVLIAFFGILVADYFSAKVKETKGKGAKAVADIGKVVILVFVALIALERIGLRVDVARNSFLIILAGLVLGVALAIGIGFGLGMQKDARKWLKKWLKKL